MTNSSWSLSVVALGIAITGMILGQWLALAAIIIPAMQVGKEMIRTVTQSNPQPPASEPTPPTQAESSG
ncbi:hypothetical protein [Antrihabitans spumae]|uniref:AI-2E family transporter n=1 Tax=Antrihabitans spumae TaxID=3373370 RepID=A0ABW7KIE9_9NOCA